MKNFKKIVALVLTFAFVLCLAACGGDDTDTDNESTNNGSIDESAVISKSDINFIKDGNSVYRIVRPASAEKEVLESASDLFRHMKSTLGVSLKNVPDDEEQGDNAEIIIGETNRPETATAKQLLRQKNGRVNSYIIASINNSIVIYGASTASTLAAVEYFKSNFVKTETVSGGIDYSFVDSSAFSNITIGQNTDMLDYVIVKPQYNLSYIAALEIEKLQKQLYDTFGYEVDIVKDSEATASDREIVVGASKREGVEQIIAGDTVSVKISGNKVFLNGGSTYSVAAAVTEFSNMLKAGKDIKLTDASSKQTDYDTVAAAIDNTVSYKATFREAFDSPVGPKSTSEKWNNFNDYNQYGQNGKWAKRAKEDYSNLSFVDGKFITQIAEDDGAYYGSMLTTQNKMAFKYGYFEISQIMPKGMSFWTSLWTRPAFATSLYWVEIDVNENFGTADFSRGNCFPWLTSKGTSEGLNQQGNSIAWENYYSIESKDLYSDYHTYGCEWNYDTIAFYRDGELLEKKNIDDLHNAIALGLRNQHSYLILGCIAGSDNLTTEQIKDVTPEEWAKTSRYYIDDVVVYQLAGQDMKFDYKDSHYGYTTKMYYND